MMTRRCLLKRLLLGIVAVGLLPGWVPAKSASINEKKQAFRWRVPKVHFETVQKALQFEGKVAPDKDAKGVMLFIFAGAVLLPALAKAVLALRREMVHGGIVIDTRGKAIDIQTDKSLPGSVIVVVTPNGTDFYETDEIGNLAELVKALRKGA